MTGQGHASGLLGNTSIEVDVRSVNNRFLKVTSRISDRLQTIEGSLETLVRKFVRRGMVNISIRQSGELPKEAYRLNAVALEAYAQQASTIAERLKLSNELNIGQLLQLPGVVNEYPIDVDDSDLIGLASDVIEEALVDMNRMREREGRSMGKELAKGLEDLRARTRLISDHAPRVVEDYQVRLRTKIEQSLRELGMNLAPVDLLREVQIYADRCDIREELVRLESHFDQFDKACGESESQGRKLDFLVQELNREINTIGSKANDSTITEQVVAMKTTLEQVREIIQNIE